MQMLRAAFGTKGSLPAALFVDQLVSIVVVLAYSFVVTFVIAKVLDATIGLRASAEDETVGLDQAQHAETAYIFGGGGFDRVR